MISKVWRWAKRAVGLAAAVAVLTIAAEVVVSGEILKTHRLGSSLATPVDAAIVLGASLDPDGRPSWHTRRRVQAAVALLNDGKAGALIFSGGSPNALQPSATELMRDHALELGAPADRLLVETGSHTTIDNLEFSLPLADARGYRRLALVSDAFHLARAWALAAWMGRPDVELVSVDHRRWHWRHDVPMMHLREAVAWWLNLGRVAGWHVLGVFGVPPDDRWRRMP